MREPPFRALLLRQQASATVAAIEEVPYADLPAGDVVIQVAYSSLNYKDGLAITGTGKVIRNFPMIPGIDLAGTVVESSASAFRPGDAVLVTGWGIGERHWGGMGQYARVPAGWVTPLPATLTAKHAMVIGTAGFTAMLCVQALEKQGVTPGEREVLVTGAAGGVGSVAVALLARRGYRVTASTGRSSTHEYLRALGASTIIGRDELAAPGKPLETERWAGAVDTVGGATLAGVIRAVAYGGSVAACGNAGGATLTTSVFPFILRGVNLLGVESVTVPQPQRVTAWARLAEDLDASTLDQITTVIPLAAVPDMAQTIIQGGVQGRVVVDVGA